MSLNTNGLDPHQKAFINLIHENARQHRTHTVFADFCELAALSISNAVDKPQYKTRETRYLDIIKKYSTEQANRFPVMLAEIVNSLTGYMHDCLGQLFMSLDLGSHWHGQFFTPYHISLLMAKLTTENISNIVADKGFFTVHEPACGAGAMVIALAETVSEQGINYQTQMHVIAQDIDPTACHMAYLQLSLLHIPAVVVRGNTLTGEQLETWKTPAHVLGCWDKKLASTEPPAANTRVNATSTLPARVVTTDINLGKPTQLSFLD